MPSIQGSNGHQIVPEHDHAIKLDRPEHPTRLPETTPAAIAVIRQIGGQNAARVEERLEFAEPIEGN